MKTLAELREMHFIPHHDCGVCGAFVGWYANEPHPYFDPSCDCGSSDGHNDTWENVFRWYNTVFEKESEDAVQKAWEDEKDDRRRDKCGEVVTISQNEIQDFVSGCGIACATCKSMMSLSRGRMFSICDDCLKDLREIIKERRNAKR